MNVHTPAGSCLQLGLNGSRDVPERHSGKHRARFEDEALRYLSHDERECILFLEETIDALDYDLEDLDQSSRSSTPVERHYSIPSLATVPEVPKILKEQDIIDLVQNQPSPLVPREEMVSSIIPDFQNLAVDPETHFEVKSRRDRTETFPLTYSFPLPSPPSVPAEESDSLYHPAGSIPTPVLIAQKIAEHQGSGGAVTPSSLLSGRRRSLDAVAGGLSSVSDHPAKQGPPTTAKPCRYPDNINVFLSSRDYNQTISKANVNVQQRQAQVLANLTGTSPTYEMTESNQLRKFPNRSISFHDPAPDKSRMEALSKLGLTRDRAMSSPNSRVSSTIITPLPIASECHSNSIEYDYKPEATASYLSSSSKTPISSNDFNVYSGRTKVITPSAASNKADTGFLWMMSSDKDLSLLSDPGTDSPPCSSSNYGHKTHVIPTVPPVSAASDITSQRSSEHDSGRMIGSPPLGVWETKTEISSEYNNYGGKKMVMPSLSTPVANTVSLSSVIVKDGKPTELIPSSLSNNADNLSYGNYRNKTRAEVLSQTSTTKPDALLPKSGASTTTPRAPALSSAARSVSFKTDLRPPEGTKLGRQNRTASFHGGQLASTPSEPRRRSFSKQPFWPQGITVQFSGRGPTDGSRREALRKLGLLKDTS